MASFAASASDPKPEECLKATPIVDSDHPLVQEFTKKHSKGTTDVEKAVSLYYACRDEFRYDPYQFSTTEEGLKASTVIKNGFGW
jgi:transglutaminase-like putative cysteine protease